MRYALLLISFALCAPLAFGQKKKSKNEAAQLRIDSLTAVNAMLTAQLDSVSRMFGTKTLEMDSVSRMLQEHQVMYDAIKEKVMRADFAPLRTSELIDSLKTARDKSMTGLTTEAQAQADTVVMLRQENAELKSSLSAWETRGLTNEQAAEDLELLKSLLDQKILTQEEFDMRKRRILSKWK